MFPPIFGQTQQSSRSDMGSGSQREPRSLFEMWLEQMENTQLEMALEESRRQYEEELDHRKSEIDLRAVEEICLDLEDLENNKQCAICFEDQRCGDSAIRLLCGHCFHKTCCIPWFRKHSTCPVCRFELSRNRAGPEMTEQERLERERFQQKIEQKRQEKLIRLEEQRRKVMETGETASAANGSISNEEKPEVCLSKERMTSGDESSGCGNLYNHFQVSNSNKVVLAESLKEELTRASVRKLKSILKKLGLGREGEFFIEKSDLVSLILESTDRVKLVGLSVSKIKERLISMNVEQETLERTEDLSSLLAHLSINIIENEL